VDRRRGERRQRHRSPAVERRLADRRRSVAKGGTPDYRLAYRGDGFDVYEATSFLSTQCGECGITVVFEMPRFGEPPARLELRVIHEEAESQPQPLRARHLVEIQTFGVTGRPLLAARHLARTPYPETPLPRLPLAPASRCRRRGVYPPYCQRDHRGPALPSSTVPRPMALPAVWADPGSRPGGPGAALVRPLPGLPESAPPPLSPARSARRPLAVPGVSRWGGRDLCEPASPLSPPSASGGADPPQARECPAACSVPSTEPGAADRRSSGEAPPRAPVIRACPRTVPRGAGRIPDGRLRDG